MSSPAPAPAPARVAAPTPVAGNQQLSFDIINRAVSSAGTQNVIYITSDAAYNKVTLQILISSGTATLQPGTITDPSVPPTNGSVFYVDLSELQLSASAWQALTVPTTGWTFQRFANSILGMTPTTSTPVSSGSDGAINLTIEGLVVAKALSSPSATLYVTYYGVTGVSGMYFSFPVALYSSPAEKGRLADVIKVTTSSTTIINSCNSQDDTLNGFILQFSQGDEAVAVKAGPATVFSVSFVYGKPKDKYGYGALTDAVNALNIDVNKGVNADKWLLTKHKDQQSPSWSLKPPNGVDIVGSGALSIVGINFDSIVTDYQAGPTVMLVSYSNVPGYSDGAFSIVLEKIAHVYVNSITATPNPAVLKDGKAVVQLSWSAKAPTLTLMPGQIRVSGHTSHSCTITDTTVFTLIAEGQDPRNRASLDVKVDILPVINSIHAEPQDIYYNDFPHDVLLDWNVNTGGTVVLSNSLNSKLETLPASYTSGENISGAAMFTLTPTEGVAPFLIKRHEVISAFQLASRTVTLQGNPVGIAVAPMANLYAVVSSGSDAVAIVESVTNTAYCPPLAAGKQPACVAFSHAGDYLFVGNQGDKTLSVIRVAFDAGSNRYAFNKVKDVSLSGVPGDIDVASDDSYVFVTTNGTKGHLDAIRNDGDGNFSVGISIPIGASVDGVTALPSIAQVFVASAAGATVSVVGYSSISDSFQLVGTIKGFQSNDSPCDVAIAGQEQSTLLIACKGSNSVYAINKDASSVSGRQKLSVGQAPARIVTIEAGSYAYVANSGSNSISLVSCFSGSGFCKVLENALPTGASPGALAASGDGSILYVPNTGGSSITVFNAQTYVDGGVQSSVPVPTSIAASDQWVVSWYNYARQIKVPGTTPAPGLSVYDRSSETIDTVNATSRYIDLKFWPDPAFKRAFATLYGDNQLYLLETDGFTTAQKIPLSTSPTCVPVGISISPWGNAVFVLTADTGGVYALVAVACDMAINNCRVVATVPLFTNPAASTKLVAAVSDGSKVFVTDSFQKKMYVVSKTAAGAFALSPTTYSFLLLPHGLVCSPDDGQLYVWMNENANSGFARFDIQSGTLENFSLPGNISLQVNDLAISPDGSRLFVTDPNFGGVRIFSTAAMQNTENLPLAGASFPLGVAIAPDASEIYTANLFSANFSIGQQLQPVARVSATPGVEARVSAMAGIEAVLDAGQDYQGIFLRDYIGQTPATNAGSGWTSSPDIFPAGTTLLANPADFGNLANYGTDYGTNVSTMLDQINYVYVRGLNTTNGPQTSRVYFFWVESATVLLPSQWSPYNFQFQGNVQNWLDITAPGPKQIAYSPAPLFWQPSSACPHYCLVAWIDNSSTPSPPDLAQYAAFATWEDVGQFIMSHPNLAWRNTNDIKSPGAFMNAATKVKGPQDGGDVTVGVILKNIPAGGTIQFSLTNSDGRISYNSPVHTIDTNTFSQTISWPADAPEATLVYKYVPAATVPASTWYGAPLPPMNPIPAGAQITAFTSYLPGLALFKRVMLRNPSLLAKVPKANLSSVTEMILGTVKYNYTGS